MKLNKKKRKRKDQTYFSKDWLEEPDFKNCLVSFTNNSFQTLSKDIQFVKYGEASTSQSCKRQKPQTS